MARWVHWRTELAPVEAPIVVFVDVSGGPADRLAANLDVTTFLNDRFHPVISAAYQGQPLGTVAFYDSEGCILAGPVTPPSPKALIDLANQVLVRRVGAVDQAPRLPTVCHPSPR